MNYMIKLSSLALLGALTLFSAGHGMAKEVTADPMSRYEPSRAVVNQTSFNTTAIFVTHRRHHYHRLHRHHRHHHHHAVTPKAPK